MDIHCFMGTACSWNVCKLFIPVNSSIAELKLLCKSVLRCKQFRQFLLSIRFISGKSTKVYEDNEAIVNTVTSQRITLCLRYADIPICFLHNEHAKGFFSLLHKPQYIQIANVGTKPELEPHLLRLSSLAMGHVYLKDLSNKHYNKLICPSLISVYNYYKRDY